MYESLNVPVKNQDKDVVGNATLYYTGRIDIITDDEGKQLFDMFREGLAESITIRADLTPAHPLNGPVVETLTIPHPALAPFGVKLSKQGVKDVWDAFVVPVQNEGKVQSTEFRSLMAILRAVGAGMPEDEV